MSTKRSAPILFACLLLAASGCGSSDDDNGGGGGSSEPAPTSGGGGGGGGGGAASSSATDTIENFAFDPDAVTVKAGGTITWTNKDSAAHNVVFDDKSIKSIENLNSGESGDITFDKAGTFDYVCTYHSGMKGSVEVQ